MPDEVYRLRKIPDANFPAPPQEIRCLAGGSHIKSEAADNFLRSYAYHHIAPVTPVGNLTSVDESLPMLFGDNRNSASGTSQPYRSLNFSPEICIYPILAGKNPNNQIMRIK